MPFDHLPYQAELEKHGFVPANHSEPVIDPVEAGLIFDGDGRPVDGYQRIYNGDSGRTYQIATDAYKVLPFSEFAGGVWDAMLASDLDLTGAQVAYDTSRQGAVMFQHVVLPAYTKEIAGRDPITLSFALWASHDGTLAARGHCGFFEWLCANQSIVGEKLASLSRRHTKALDVSGLAGGLAAAATAALEPLAALPRLADLAVTDQAVAQLFDRVKNKSISERLSRLWLDNDRGKTAWGVRTVLTNWATHGDDADDGLKKLERLELTQRLFGSKTWAGFLEDAGAENIAAIAA